MKRPYKCDPVVGEDGIFTNLLQAQVAVAHEAELDHTLNECQN